MVPPEDLEIKEFSIMESNQEIPLRKKSPSKHKHREAFYYKREVVPQTQRSLQTIDIEGKDQLMNIINEKDFEYEIYTPKHSCKISIWG